MNDTCTKLYLAKPVSFKIISLLLTGICSIAASNAAESAAPKINTSTQQTQSISPQQKSNATLRALALAMLQDETIEGPLRETVFKIYTKDNALCEKSAHE